MLADASTDLDTMGASVPRTCSQSFNFMQLARGLWGDLESRVLDKRAGIKSSNWAECPDGCSARHKGLVMLR